ncbi:glycosyltransferase family 2 protein [Priestia megaterium]|uniref:glycosyltransferase family 2 protein n=1 Tax=Priestia megaterium TaxID=1404 RepID=UPI00406BA20A
MNISIIIPTLNAEKDLKNNLLTLNKYNQLTNYEVIVVDSQSTDNTVKIAKEQNYKVIEINRKDFNHGGTRNLAATYANGDILVYLTQDIIIYEDQSIHKLIQPLLENENIGLSYGRQLPHENAGFFGSMARLFNYDENSLIKNQSNSKELGIKTVFCSNSFAAYRKSTLEQVGGFPKNVILGEDSYVAGKMILKGWAIYYCAEAKVRHSHDYNLISEFKRNFDIGVFHTHEKWILESFNGAEGEGVKFVIKEINYLIKSKKIHLIPISFLRNASKYLGYKLGRNEKYLNGSFKKKISMYNGYWQES